MFLRPPQAGLRIPSPSSANPAVSIIIPAYDRDVFTYNCLRSLCEHWDESISAEVIVVDDGSHPPSQAFLQSIEGIRYVRNEQNLGFIASCNRGAQLARGRFAVFLNNDTIVQGNWLAPLLGRIQSSGDVGAVGSMLLYPDGSLAEAGAIVWSDGSGWNYGRHCDPEDPAFNYARDVDYCSAASLLVDRLQFVDAGGFDTRYAPAYYEDADYAFRLRARGSRVVFEPRSLVAHFEGVTGGVDPRRGIKRYQVRNRAIFAEKWAADLRSHESPDPKNVSAAARRWSGRPRVLFIDAFIPFYDRDAGSLRLATIMTLARQLGCDVLFYPGDGVAHEPYATALRAQGIEVLCRTRRRDARAILIDRLPLVDIVWICRPELAETYLPLLHSSSRRIYYDTVDLHFIRLQREESVTGRKRGWQQMRRRELQLAKTADATIVSSPDEALVLEADGVGDVRVIPPMYTAIEHRAPWADRAGFVFVGNYVHAPNVDATIYLTKEVFPLIAERLPGARLTLVGNEPPPSVRALRSELVDVTGHVENLDPFMQRARVFIAPIRFGAGLKGKILQSMAYGVPVVTTPVGAEGIGLTHGVDALIAERPEALADFAASLHEDPSQWQQISTAASARIDAFTPAAISAKLQALLQPSQALRADYANTRMSKVCATKE